MPVVVSGTYQVLSKCFLGEYLMNVSKKKINNNNAGCEQSTSFCNDFKFFYFLKTFSCLCFSVSFIDFWPPWVFVALCGLFQVAASRSCSLLWAVVFSLRSVPSLVAEHRF